MIPTWDQTTIAVTIRSTGTASTSSPSEPVFPRPIPTPASRRATIQSGTLAAIPASEMPATARRHGGEHERPRLHPAGHARARGDDDRRAHVERSDLRLAEALGEVERQHALEHAECEDGEQDGGGGDPEAARSQRRAVGREVAPGGGLRDEQDERHGEQQQTQIGEERAVDAAEDAEGGADQPTDRVGREHAAHAEVLLARPALERVEGHADPDPAGADPHQQARGEVDRQRVPEHEAEGTKRHERERAGQQHPRAGAAHEPAREREAGDHARGK